MEHKKLNINLSTFNIITLIIILIIGIILLIVKNRSKNEYSIKILDYLKNKYGSDTEFEIKDINSEDKEFIGDGYAWICYGN